MILKVEKGDTVWNSFKTAMQKLLSELEIVRFHVRFRQCGEGSLIVFLSVLFWPSTHIPNSEESFLSSVTLIKFVFFNTGVWFVICL